LATDLYSNSFSDNFRLAKSKTFAGGAAGVYNAIRIPKHAFVFDVWVNVFTAYTGGGAVIVGYTGNGEVADDNGFITTLVLTSLATYRSVEGSGARAGGMYFKDASGVITFTYDDTSVSAAGAFIVFCAFSIII